MTESGYAFINYTALTGNKVQTDDAVWVSVSTYIGDSLVGSTRRDFGGPRQLFIPAADKLSKPAPPIFDALTRMVKGDSASIVQVVDSTLAKRLPPNLRHYKSIRYDIVLVDHMTRAEYEKAEADRMAKLKERYQEVEKLVNQTLKDNKAKKLNDQTVTTPSGLKAVIFDKGSGPAVGEGESLKTHYYGCFLDGKVFDNSFLRGEPLEFTLGGMMIPGYEEGVKMLHHGGKALFFIPYELAYGAEGNEVIPPKTNLVFYIELL